MYQQNHLIEHWNGRNDALDSVLLVEWSDNNQNIHVLPDFDGIPSSILILVNFENSFWVECVLRWDHPDQIMYQTGKKWYQSHCRHKILDLQRILKSENVILKARIVLLYRYCQKVSWHCLGKVHSYIDNNLILYIRNLCQF